MGFPNLPGVPPLSNLNSTMLTGAVTLAAPLLTNLLDKLKKGWSIVDVVTLKTEVIKPDSFISIDFHNESNLPVAPMEQGAFSTYNKVPTPFTAVVKVAKGAQLNPLNTLSSGSSDLKGFIDTLFKVQGDTNLYAIVTPDKTHLNVNLKGIDYKRELHNGAAMILATLSFVEVMRQSQVSAQITSPTTVAPNPTACPQSAAPPISLGSVQSTVINAAASTALSKLQLK